MAIFGLKKGGRAEHRGRETGRSVTPKKLSDHSLVRLGRSAMLEKLKNTVSAELFGKSPVLLLKWPVLLVNRQTGPKSPKNGHFGTEKKGVAQNSAAAKPGDR